MVKRQGERGKNVSSLINLYPAQTAGIAWKTEILKEKSLVKRNSFIHKGNQKPFIESSRGI